MWVVEELRAGVWVRISGMLSEFDALAAARTLRGDRPTRVYRAVPHS